MALFSQIDATEGKVIGCEPDEIDELKAMAVADVILVEADGARHCALKAPAAHEPCIPRGSNTVIALTGAAPLGCPANPADIHRWPQFAAITGLRAGDPINQIAWAACLRTPRACSKTRQIRPRGIGWSTAKVRSTHQFRPCSRNWPATIAHSTVSGSATCSNQALSATHGCVLRLAVGIVSSVKRDHQSACGTRLKATILPSLSGLSGAIHLSPNLGDVI